jgi:CBS domain-containing protein
MRVADLMDARPAYADADLTVEEFVVEHALRGGRLELVVLGAGRLLGIVTVADARAVPQERWSTTPVARIMRHAPIPVLAPEAPVRDVLEVIAGSAFAQIPVVRDSWVVGMFGRADLTRYRWLRANLQLQERHRGADAARRPTADLPGH